MRELGEQLWEHIGREPSGSAFNSLVQLESEQGIPRNPFINAGAIAVTDRLVSRIDAKSVMLALLSSLCGDAVQFDEEVAASEAATGFRNVALANFMKSFSRIDNDVGTVLDVPDRLTLCVWSPALEHSGNSLLGMKALELFTAKTGLSVF